MNDFTKEELMIIAASLGTICEFHKCQKTSVVALKVIDMVNNYNDRETVMVRGVERKLSEFDIE